MKDFDFKKRKVESKVKKTSLMSKAYCSAMSLLMVMSLVVFSTGCKMSQAQFDSVVTKVGSQMPTLEALVVDISMLANNPALVPIVQKFVDAAKVDLPAFKNTVDAYLSNKTAGTKAAIFAAFSTAAGQVNSWFLQVNGFANPQTDQALLMKIGIFVAIVNGIQVALAVFSPMSAWMSNATPYSAVQAYIPTRVKEQVR